MVDSPRSDDWGKGSLADDKDRTNRPLQTVQSKFLDAVKSYAELRYVELIVDFETPTSGYGYIQKKEGFSNLYSFHFEFTSEAATFYLGTEKVATASPEQRRNVQFSGGTQLEDVLTEIRAGIDSASREVFPALSALSAQRDAPATIPIGSLRNPPVPARDAVAERRDAAVVWGQDEKGTRAEMMEGQRRGSPWPRRGAMIAIIAVAFLLFIPIIATNTASPACSAINCGTAGDSNGITAPYYASVTSHFFGVGGEYFPPNHGWAVNEFFGAGTGVNGTRSYGFAAGGYYFTA